MRGFGLGAAPPDVVGADVARFNQYTMDLVIQHSGLALDAGVVRRYCEWFVGREYGWKETRGGEWRESYSSDWAGCLGQHLGHHQDERLRRTSMHMTCKAGKHNGTRYYWTRYVAIDIDQRDHHHSVSLRERYDACVDALGVMPVVLRSPRQGLHLVFPLTASAGSCALRAIAS